MSSDCKGELTSSVIKKKKKCRHPVQFGVPQIKWVWKEGRKNPSRLWLNDETIKNLYPDLGSGLWGFKNKKRKVH